MNNLTEKQKEIYNAIVNYYNDTWRMPRVRDLTSITGKSIKTVWDYLRRIEDKGYIKIKKKKKRGIEIIKELED